jgi:AraC-like DNA-binding protein
MTGLRMKNAEALLGAMWTNSYTISEIAQMCGFEDALYFSRVFKKYYGCSPSNFGKRQQVIHGKDPGRTELDTADQNASSE